MAKFFYILYLKTYKLHENLFQKIFKKYWMGLEFGIRDQILEGANQNSAFLEKPNSY